MDKKKTTKELLGESLAELLQDKAFEKITVNEIAENCGVGRRSFYNNFKDKYDLAAWLYIRQLKNYYTGPDCTGLEDFIRYSMDTVKKDAQLIIAIDQYKGQNNLRESLVRPLTDIYIHVIEKYHDCIVDEKMRRDIEFYVGGQITFVGRVIGSPEAPDDDESFDLFIRCMPQSMKQFM